MNTFAAIDVETANEQHASVCGAGVVRIHDGEIKGRFYLQAHRIQLRYRQLIIPLRFQYLIQSIVVVTDFCQIIEQ